MQSPALACAAPRPFASFAALPKARLLEGARVLVVDDEPGIAELLQDLLEAAGCSVCTAGSGREALLQLRTQTFDLVISDLRMPDIDGAGLWRALSSSHPALATRVLFVTGDTLSPAAHAFLAETGCPSLDKPFARGDLLRSLAALQVR
jgi:two-component system NtrC family sensor kinase